MADSMDQIIMEMEALVKRAFVLGSDRAFNKMLEAAKQDDPHTIQNFQRKPQSKNNAKGGLTGKELGYRPGTTIAKVHSFIKSNPGNTGSEIFEMLSLVETGIEERTVRTSLNRLKSKWGGLIENREGKWYPRGTLFD